MKARSLTLAVILASASPCTATAQSPSPSVIPPPPGPPTRHENFNTDPAWEGRSNRNVPAAAKGARASKTITQDFEHRTSHFAGGKDAGEVGGSIYKHPSLASYAKPIPIKTLDDRLSASGTLFLRESDVSSAIMVGWFNASESRGWRTRNALAFRLFGTKGYGRFTFEYGTQKGGMASSTSSKPGETLI
jgi:hypothetical protein